MPGAGFKYAHHQSSMKPAHEHTIARNITKIKNIMLLGEPSKQETVKRKTVFVRFLAFGPPTNNLPFPPSPTLLHSERLLRKISCHGNM